MKKTKWLRRLCNVDLLIACAALAILVLNTLIAMVMRFAMEKPPIWPKEVQVFCQVWMAFLGAGAAFRYGAVSAVGAFADLLPEKGRRVLGYLADIPVVFILTFMMIKYQQYVLWFFGGTHVRTASLGIPYELIYGISPFSCALMIVSYLLNRYLPGFVRKMDTDAACHEGEVTAQ